MRFETELYNELSEKKGAIKLVSAVMGLTFAAMGAGVGVGKYMVDQRELESNQQIAAKFSELAKSGAILPYPDKGTRPASELTICVYDAVLEAKSEKGRAVIDSDIQQIYQDCANGLEARYKMQVSADKQALQMVPVQTGIFTVAAGTIGGIFGGLISGLLIAGRIGDRRRAAKAARSNTPII